MSCCGGNCGCGSACKCGSDCGGCKMYPDLSYSETAKTTAQTLVQGVTPQKKENGGCMIGEAGAEEGCHCGPNCQCNPCTCN